MPVAARSCGSTRWMILSLRERGPDLHSPQGRLLTRKISGSSRRLGELERKLLPIRSLLRGGSRRDPAVATRPPYAFRHGWEVLEKKSPPTPKRRLLDSQLPEEVSVTGPRFTFCLLLERQERRFTLTRSAPTMAHSQQTMTILRKPLPSRVPSSRAVAGLLLRGLRVFVVPVATDQSQQSHKTARDAVTDRSAGLPLNQKGANPKDWPRLT